MFRRSVVRARGLVAATPALRMNVMLRQPEMNAPLVAKDGHVQSFHDEFMRPPVSKEMEAKYGQFGKYSDPAFAKVDVSNEVVLNTYPEGTPHGMIQQQHSDLNKYHAGFFSEDFFRKHILKPKVAEVDEDKARVTDYALNSIVIGASLFSIRYMLAPLWWIGNPRLTLVFESNVEAEVGILEPKECKTIVWRGKPIYVYRRSEYQMTQLNETNSPMKLFKHPETDEKRFPTNREYCVVIAICTHLGCVPAPNEGIYNGFFCPCHGSHYDASGRIRQGPAPLNLEVPPYKWLNIDEGLLYLGN